MENSSAAPARTLLQVGGLPPTAERALVEEFDVLRLPDQDPGAFLRVHAQDVVAAVTNSMTGVGGDLMRSLPHLKAVINFGVGYETTDVESARGLGIQVSNTPDVLTDCVADLAVGLTLDVARGISASDRFVRRGQWPHSPFPLGTRVSGARVGIVGLGRIGQAISRRMEAFGCAIAYHSRHRVPGVDHPWMQSAEELAAGSDVLIVAVSGGTSTAGLISREVLEALGPEGILVNISRGAVVDEHALVEMLVERRIAGAGLDVFVKEPQVTQELFELDHVVLTPHLGSATAETRQDMADLFLENVRTFMDSGAVSTPVR